MNHLGKTIITAAAGAALRGPVKRIIVRRAAKGKRFARWLVDTFAMDGSVVEDATELAKKVRERKK